MGKLSDILGDEGADKLRALWDSMEAPAEFEPLPAGEYVAQIIDGKLSTSSRNHTPSYKLTFKVVEGNYAGRQIWHDLWLTEAAFPLTTPQLAKLGFTKLDETEHPPRAGIRCRVKLALWCADNGSEHNSVSDFDVEGIAEPQSEDVSDDFS